MMSTATDTNETADPPVFPGERSPRCPFDPPAGYPKWREAKELQQAVRNGHTAWVVSRFEDIKAAMTDPRISQILARAELEIALPTLLRRLPDLRLTVPFEEPRFRGDMSIYGVHELPVTW
jgi:cytochrome P450